MNIKPYEELTIQDNFLFQKIMRNKGICQRVIERLLDIQVRDIVYQEEEKSIDVRLDSKSIRLDVYVNDENGTVFNIEMQTTRDMYELAKRTRYYQALIDIDLLEKGRAEGILENTLANIRSLMKTTNWTAKQAMQALQIPAEEYDKYLAMI